MKSLGQVILHIDRVETKCDLIFSECFAMLPFQSSSLLDVEHLPPLGVQLSFEISGDFIGMEVNLPSEWSSFGVSLLHTSM